MIRLRQLAKDDLHDDFLKGYIRYQETKKLVRVVDGKLTVIPEYFVETWNSDKLTEISRYLKQCIIDGGKVVAIMKKDRCIGFANVENKTYQDRYFAVHYCHISKPYRNKGLGKKLFNKLVEVSKSLGVNKLYISSHPAIETQAFYKSVGCVSASTIVTELYEIEPLDIQLEYVIKKEKT